MLEYLPVFPIALLISFMWGLQPIIHKMLLTHHVKDPKVIFVLSGLFYMSALTIFILINWDSVTKGVQNIPTNLLLVIAFTAIATGFLPNLLYYFILKKSTSYLVATLIYSSPIFTLVASYLLLKEKISIYGFLGIVAIVCGVLLLAINDQVIAK